MTQQQAVKQSPKYFIDEGWYELQSRSLQHMIDSRMSSVETAQVKAPEKPSSRRKAKAATVKAPTMESLSKVEGFIHPDLTILEAVFRLLLVNQNKPMDVQQISQELAEHGIGVMDTRMVNPQSLTRMLDSDFHYGIRRHSGD
ncbi:MAG: hypothetical protein HW397_164 [Dehalococcoidia bacterium]|nr:hypothetical protein [Dehalococcoidia bacterium]